MGYRWGLTHSPRHVRLVALATYRKPPADTGHKPPKVLIVDDEEDVLDLINEFLRRTGFDTVKALGPTAARAAARQSSFDLLLCDVEMLGTRGPVLARELVAQRPSLRVVLMSGSASKDSVPFRLVLKPCSASELVSAIEEEMAVRVPERNPQRNNQTGKLALPFARKYCWTSKIPPRSLAA